MAMKNEKVQGLYPYMGSVYADEKSADSPTDQVKNQLTEGKPILSGSGLELISKGVNGLVNAAKSSPLTAPLRSVTLNKDTVQPRANVNASELLGQGIRRGGQLATVPAALAYDTAALVPRALSRVGGNIVAGITGTPADNSPFNTIPATQSAIKYVNGGAGAEKANPAASHGSTASANPLTAEPGSKIVAMGAGGAPITEADAANIKATHERMAAYDAAQKAKGGDTIEEANKKLWTQSADFFGKNGVKGFEKYQSQPGQAVNAQHPLARTPLAQPPANIGGQVMDVHNGNRVDRVTTGGGGIQRISHGSPTLTGDPKKDAINIAAFNAEVNAWNSLNNPKENGLIESRNAVKADHYPEQAQLERDKMNREDQRESRKDQNSMDVAALGMAAKIEDPAERQRFLESYASSRPQRAGKERGNADDDPGDQGQPGGGSPLSQVPHDGFGNMVQGGRLNNSLREFRAGVGQYGEKAIGQLYDKHISTMDPGTLKKFYSSLNQSEQSLLNKEIAKRQPQR